MTTIFKNPDFTQLESNQFYEKNIELISRIVKEFLKDRLDDRKVIYIDSGDIFYDLVGFFSSEKGWEIIPVPVFVEVFVLDEDKNLRNTIIRLCPMMCTRNQWIDESALWAVGREKFSRPFDEKFRKELEDWLPASEERIHCKMDRGDAVSDGVNYIIYPPAGGFELWGGYFKERIALSRDNPKLFKRLGGEIRI